MSCKLVSKAVLLHLIFFCHLSLSKKVSLPGSDGRKSGGLNECDRCKVLTDSFNYWLKKTTRGKYEGGDTAWEESKLKSYALSEIRLVEIQEGLCSELNKNQDYCYAFNEEAEQLLEKWWFLESRNAIDLNTWLCIEMLKYCCPANHFGKTCSPCPLDKDNKICSGQGRCDGDGTRKGNGTCICKRGYTGNYCEECAENFFSDVNGSCEQCHRSCSGCSGEGASACLSCRPGWQKEAGVCIDTDECMSPSSCKTNEICINSEGSFKCKACDTTCKTCVGLGANNCNSCDDFKVLWDSMCITKSQLDDIITSTLKRFCIYLALLLIVTFISCSNYSYLNSGGILFMFFVVVIACLEATANINTLKVVTNIYQDGHRDVFIDITTKMANLFSQLSFSK